jgi:hypothetical protein
MPLRSKRPCLELDSSMLRVRRGWRVVELPWAEVYGIWVNRFVRKGRVVEVPTRVEFNVSFNVPARRGRALRGCLIDMETDRPLGSTELAGLLAGLTPDHVIVELVDVIDHLADF